MDIIYSEDTDALGKFVSSQWKYDVVHFMYEGLYLKLHKYLYRPCALTLWHLEEISSARRLFAGHQVDALCIHRINR